MPGRTRHKVIINDKYDTQNRDIGANIDKNPPNCYICSVSLFKNIFTLSAVLSLMHMSISCSCGHEDASGGDSASMFANPLLTNISSVTSWCTYYDGIYYFIESSGHDIMLRSCSDVTGLRDAQQAIIYSNKSYRWLSDPVIYKIDGIWYIYLGIQDGDLNHRSILVLENTASDPVSGKFVVKGRLDTGPEDCIAIQPNTFVFRGRRYLIWSGWDEQRTFEEYQNIYIAGMSDPCTVQGERVKISVPEYVWERQWIGTRGNTVAYPIYVNEAPCALESPDGSKLMIFYSASLRWTPYQCIGMLSMDADKDPMDARSWEKTPEPVFAPSEENDIWSVGRPCFLPSPDGSELFLSYQATSYDMASSIESCRDLRLQKVVWNSDGSIDLGIPVADGAPQNMPSGVL